MTRITRIVVSSTLLLPLIASASGINTMYLQGYATSINSIINDMLVPVLFSVAFITFLYGVYKYFILGAADEKAHADGAKMVAYALVGFVIIISVWGLVNILTNMLGLSAAGNIPRPPQLSL